MDTISKIKSFKHETKKVVKPKLKGSKSKTTYAGYKELPPSIKPDLNLLFIGFNPGVESSKTQHHYAHHTNLFWKLFNQANILEKSLLHQGVEINYDDPILSNLLTKASAINDLQLINYQIGFSDLVLRCTKTAQELSMQEKLDNIPRLIDEFKLAKPKKVAIIGKGIWEVFIKYLQVPLNFEWGLQPKSITENLCKDNLDIEIYVFPSTSGLVTTMNYQQKLSLWNSLYGKDLTTSDGEVAS